MLKLFRGMSPLASWEINNALNEVIELLASFIATIPTPAVGDAGKIVGVDATGKYALTYPSANVYAVEVTYNDDSSEFETETTLSDFTTAMSRGKKPCVTIPNVGTVSADYIKTTVTNVDYCIPAPVLVLANNTPVIFTFSAGAEATDALTVTMTTLEVSSE